MFSSVALLLAGLATVGPIRPTPRPTADRGSVAIRFAARLGDQPFACGREYPGVGTSGATISPLDFRMYVSGVELLDAKGRATRVQLAQDGVWQYQQVALLDFEDNVSPCANGTDDTRLVIEGTAPKGKYTGLRFVLGVPFEMNHKNLVEQPSPLNLTSLFWVWRAGYKFLRLDVKSNGPVPRLFLHLGSTGCVGQDSLPASPAIRCSDPNRSTITLADFVADRDTVVVDVGSLFEGSDLGVNQARTAPGCMSAPDDQDCGPLFDRLGLPFAGKPSAGQRVFRVARGGR